MNGILLPVALVLLAPLLHAAELCSRMPYDHYQVETREDGAGRVQFVFCSTLGARHCSRVGKKEWYKRAELVNVYNNWLFKRPDVQVYVGPDGTPTLGEKTISMLSMGSNHTGYNGVDALPLRDEKDPEGARIIALGSALSAPTPGLCRKFNAGSTNIKRALEDALNRASPPGPDPDSERLN